MPPSQRTGRALARATRTLAPFRAVNGPMAMALALLLLFALAVAWTVHFQRIFERSERAERQLQSISNEIQAQDALEWRAISGRKALAEIRHALAESRTRGAVLVAQAVREGLPPSAEQRIVVLHRKYNAAVDEELRLLGDNRLQEAETFDQINVHPVFTDTQSAVSEYTDQLADRAAQAEKVKDVGDLVSFALMLLLAGATYSSRRLAGADQEQVRHSEARYRALVDQSADIVVVTDRQGAPEYLSPAADRLFRRTPDGELTIKDIGRAVHPDDRDMLAATLASVGPGRGATQVEVRVTTGSRDPGWRYFEVSLRDLCADAAVRGIVLTGHDVTDRRALQAEAQHQALHDNLTGLPNRALLQDRLSQSLRVAHRQGTIVGLLLIDLDRFKEVNDTLGHYYGDRLLAQIGPRLAEALRKMDTVARLGGDEFAVLLPSVRDIHGATEVAHTLLVALSRPFQVEGIQLDVEASIGVVISGAHGDDASTLIQRADIAMYVAKQRNLGVSTYHRDVDSNSPERLALLGELRRALHDDELFMHYQPKVDLNTGKLCGAEALIRWQHPDRGLIPPDDFIPLAENTGLIGPLTNRVLDLALAQIRRWVDQGHPLQIAVNLSARNLLDERLDQVVHNLMIKHGVGAALLKLEVTESAIMTDPVRATKVLERLAALGIAISIDDFGAGHTSIRQLKDLPISELKVDRSFVTDMETDPSNAVIVRSVIDLGHNLGLSIVAEGVETYPSLDCLTSFGCDVVQGYFVSRPMSVDAFECWRDAWVGLPGPMTAEGLPRGSAGRIPHPTTSRIPL